MERAVSLTSGRRWRRALVAIGLAGFGGSPLGFAGLGWVLFWLLVDWCVAVTVAKPLVLSRLASRLGLFGVF